MKRIILLLMMLGGLEAGTAAAQAQFTPAESRFISAARPAIDELLRNLPRDTALTPTQVVIDGLGEAHVRLAQTYRNVPVFEGDAIVHIDVATGRVLGTTNATLPFAPIGVAPSVTAQRASEEARVHFKHPLGLGGRQDMAIVVRDGTAQLAWKVRSEGDGPGGRIATMALVGARQQGILRAWNDLQTASVAGTAVGMYMTDGGAPVTVDQTAPTTFYLRSPAAPAYYTCDMRKGRSSCYPVTATTNRFGTGAISSTGPTAAADAEYGAETTLSYYKATFGRNGIDNANMSTYSRVHYSKGYENAFWSDSCKCMTYGDGASTFYPLVSLDVAGHEMSHGVTSRTAKLTYSGESGGLNEATSDIFGTMVEFYANSSFDTPDYKIGEMIWRSNWAGTTNRLSFQPTRALRYMYNPALDGASKNCWYSGVGSVDVHYSSGIANHFFYLLAEGSAPTAAVPAGSPTCNNSTVTGIGHDEAQQIWYLALTGYMTASTNYAGARAATINAATQKYGIGSPEVAAVAAAWAAVNVN